ncbi:MAG: pyrrolo-quinoline quinone [Bryobacteraceae bacterium]
MRRITLATVALSVFSYITAASGQVAVTTYHNDNSRSGTNFKETILTHANVNSTTFGKLFTYTVDGQVYAQPLYMPGLAITGKGTHNVVFVATENDSVYAFDADSNTGANATPLWQAAFANPAKGITPVPASDVSCENITPQIGITGTPVIDQANHTLYVVAKTKETSGATVQYYQRLHALDITSGAEKFGGPFPIQASVAGNCAPNQNGRVIFSPLRQHQRAGLVLHNDILAVMWASNCDNNPYTGWAMAFSASTGEQLAVFNDAPDMGVVSYECRAGIWQGGAAPAVDTDGNLFVATGNGYFNANNAGGLDYGDTILKLTLTKPAFTIADYFTPYNQDTLDDEDLDLGSGGLLLLPDQPGPYPHLLAQAGKEGTIYLIDRDNMGKYNSAGDTQIVQELPNAVGGMWGTCATFSGNVYWGGSNDSLKAFTLTNGLFATSPTSKTSHVFSAPGTTPSVSANGNANGIVWTMDVSGNAVLHAYNAGNLTQELYNTTQNATRDQLGPGIKFSTPTIVNGKVYVGTSSSLAVLGLL